MPTDTNVGLKAADITVRFGGVAALSGVSVDVIPGEITGLIGPNGAGKSTLFNVLMGLVRPNAGTVELDGRDITRIPPHRRASMGLCRTFQRLALFGSMTVRENVLVAAELNRRKYGDRKELLSSVDETLDRLQLTSMKDRQADSLPTGSARLLEVARALVAKSHYMLLDEPSAGLDDHETRQFGEVIRDVAKSGVGVLIVEHDIGLVMTISRRLFVLDFGTIMAEGTPDQVKSDPAVQLAYLGQPLEEKGASMNPSPPPTSAPTAGPVKGRRTA